MDYHLKVHKILNIFKSTWNDSRSGIATMDFCQEIIILTISIALVSAHSQWHLISWSIHFGKFNSENFTLKR